MKKRTKIILTISHLVTLLVSLWGVILTIGFSGSGSSPFFTISIILISLTFFSLFYNLFKNLKMYRIIGLSLYLLISPFFYMLIYEIISSIYILIKLGELSSIFSNTYLLLYILYAFLYIYPIIIFFKIYINEKREKNKQAPF